MKMSILFTVAGFIAILPFYYIAFKTMPSATTFYELLVVSTYLAVLGFASVFMVRVFFSKPPKK